MVVELHSLQSWGNGYWWVKSKRPFWCLLDGLGSTLGPGWFFGELAWKPETSRHLPEFSSSFWFLFWSSQQQSNLMLFHKARFRRPGNNPKRWNSHSSNNNKTSPKNLTNTTVQLVQRPPLLNFLLSSNLRFHRCSSNFFTQGLWFEESKRGSFPVTELESWHNFTHSKRCPMESSKQRLRVFGSGVLEKKSRFFFFLNFK